MRGLAVLTALGRGLLLTPPRLVHWARTLGVPALAAPSERAGEVADWLGTLPAPALLLVDTFPLGAACDLAPLLERAGRSWLVSRWVSPAAFLAPEPRASLEGAGRRYERIVWCEDVAPELRRLAVPQHDVGPILLETERLERPAARAALGLAPNGRLLLAIGSGPSERQLQLCRLLEKIAAPLRAEVRFVSAELPAGGVISTSFPAVRLLAAADVLVTAAGYHAFHEARLAGVPTVFVPQPRTLDDQRHRARAETIALDPSQLERAVRDALGRGIGRREPVPDGARRLAALVEDLVGDLVEDRVQHRVLGKEEVAARAGR